MSDRLLFALSTRGSARLELFNRLLDDPAISSVNQVVPRLADLRFQVTRIFEGLGHCEFDYDKRMVWACPPVLVKLPTSGLAEAVLAGGRTPALLEVLKSVVRERGSKAAMHVYRQTFASSAFPSAISVAAVSDDILKEIALAAKLGWAGDDPSAWRLAIFSAGLEEIAGTLLFENRLGLNWPEKTFMFEKLIFMKEENKASGTFKLVAYKNPADQQLRHWLWDGERASDVGRDWGRYMVLARNRKNVLFYDSRRYRMSVPSTVPLPSLLSRALMLCSGRTPRVFSLSENMPGLPFGHPYHVYDGVLPGIASLICQKAGQKMMEAVCDDESLRIKPC